MSIPAKNIPNFLPEKKNRSVPCYGSYNQAVDHMSNRALGLNKNNLFDLLNNIELEDYKGEAFSLRNAIGDNIQDLLSEIISKEDTLIEFKDNNDLQ